MIPLSNCFPIISLDPITKNCLQVTLFLYPFVCMLKKKSSFLLSDTNTQLPSLPRLPDTHALLLSPPMPTPTHALPWPLTRPIKNVTSARRTNRVSRCGPNPSLGGTHNTFRFFLCDFIVSPLAVTVKGKIMATFNGGRRNIKFS